MSKEKWQRKVDALVRLAEDHRGKPRGNLARYRLKEILAEHPEMAGYEPFVELVRADLDRMRTTSALRLSVEPSDVYQTRV